MSSSDTFAIAAHLHVLLRRKTGRVTDTEWMATNSDYAREIVRFAREKATGDDTLAELRPWADKLEAAIPEMEKPRTKTLFEAAAEALRNASSGDGNRYVGRLR